MRWNNQNYKLKIVRSWLARAQRNGCCEPVSNLGLIYAGQREYEFLYHPEQMMLCAISLLRKDVVVRWPFSVQCCRLLSKISWTAAERVLKEFGTSIRKKYKFTEDLEILDGQIRDLRCISMLYWNYSKVSQDSLNVLFNGLYFWILM